VDATDARRAQDDGIKPLPAHPALDIGLPREVDRFAPGDDEFAGLGPETARDGGAYHAAMAGDPDALGGYIERSRGHVDLGFQSSTPA
jgi:hypothetical protein